MVRRAILTYHSIDDSGSVLSTAPEEFAWQMAEMARRGIRVVRLDEIAGSAGAVALTFDDGYRNFLTAALPVLERWGYPATVFVITGYVGRENSYPGQFVASPRQPLLTWGELEEIAGRGVEVGAHTVNHVWLSRLSRERAREEIRRSQETLEERLERRVRSFSYPFGDATVAMRDYVRERFDWGVGTRLGYVREEDDRAELPRLETHYLRRRALFGRLLGGQGAGYMWLRGMLRRVGEAARAGRFRSRATGH